MADTTHSLTTYVSDMLAVEKHLRVPFDTQLNDGDFKEFQDTTDLVTRLSATTDQHISMLESTLRSLGGHEAAPVKDTVTSVAGAVAGIVDRVRKTKVSKALRDDYAALAFAIVSYEELLTTANGLGKIDVASLAQRHIEDYAGILMELGECIPSVVLRELNQIGVTVDTSTGERTRESIRQAWRSRAQTEREEPERPLGSVRGDIAPQSSEPAWSPETGTPTA